MKNVLLAVALLTPLAAIAAPSGTTFMADPRLQSPLTLEIKDQPVAEVVASVGKQCGLKLTADRDTADDKVSVIVKERPAGKVLQQVAEHFGFVWQRANGGWELAQPIAERKKEQELRLADLAPIRAEADEMFALLKTPQSELIQRSKSLYAKTQEAGLDPADKKRLERDLHLLNRVALGQPGVVQASVGLYRALTDAETARLLDGEQLRLTTANGSLPEASAKLIDHATDFGRGDRPQRQAEVVAWLSDGDPSHEFGPADRKDRRLSLSIAYNSLRTDTDGSDTIISARWTAGADQMLPAPAAIPDDPFFKQTLDLKLPGAEKALPPFFSPGPREGRRALENVWPAWPTVGDLAQAVHAAAGPELIADSFTSARFDPNRLRGKHTVGEVLKFLDEELDYTWKRDGNLVLLRSRHFYRDRPAEVPERIVRPWSRRVAKEQILNLDELGGLALALTNPQVRSMQDYWGWYLQDAKLAPPDWLYSNRYHLRFWGSLAPAQREAARNGVLPVSPMLANAFATALFSPPPTVATPSDLKRAVTSADIAAGGFSLKSDDVVEQLYTTTSPDGKQRNGTSIVTPDKPEFAQFRGKKEGFPPPDGAGVRLTDYQFQYFLAGEGKPARRVVIAVPKP